MYKKFIHLCLLLILSLTASCTTGGKSVDGTVTLDQAIQVAAENIEANLDEGTVIAVLNFSSPSERFSAYVLEELTERLVNGKKLVVVDRSELDLIRQEEKYQLSGEVSDESAQAIGKKLGAQVIVTGSIRSVEQVYRFRIRTLVVETAVIATSSSADINPREPKVVSLLNGAKPIKAQNESPIPDNMVLIQGGFFTMGIHNDARSPNEGESPLYQSTTVNSFYMGKYEVTQKEYQEVLEMDPSHFSHFKEDNFPVETVSWYDALVFCNKLSIKEGLSPAYRINGSTDPAKWNIPRLNIESEIAYQESLKVLETWEAVVEIVSGSNGYRLPTEAEWEYACRAGTTTDYNTGEHYNDSTGWYSDNSDYTTHPVGQKPANRWGLYDMHGNVNEWCWDWYGSYSSDMQTDPVGASSGSVRVVRGGSWYRSGERMHSSLRSYYYPYMRNELIGFRIVRPFVTTPAATPIRPVVLGNMVRINGGTFAMGSPVSEPRRGNDETPHQVTVSSFWMGKYEVTQKEYQEVMGTNPSFPKGDNLPVAGVSWYDALIFCNKLSIKEGLSPAYQINGNTNPAVWGDWPTRESEAAAWNAVQIVSGSNGYRLPTEAQWEYACRAGTTTAYYTGATISKSMGWYQDNSHNIQPVGQKPSNVWGLYDMYGNVDEWCWDWYGPYSNEVQTDPQGALTGDFRVQRGGSIGNNGLAPSALRYSARPSSLRSSSGFRVVCPITPPLAIPTRPIDDYLPMDKLSRPPEFDAREINSALIYPRDALNSKIEGRVILELFVDENGIVQQISIMREDPKGYGFGEAAIRAFTGRKGAPAMANGKAVAARYRYPVSFRIK